MILVTTAGKVGAEAARLPAQREEPVRLLVRDPENATALAQLGIDVAVGDLDVPATIDAAMRGISAVVLVSPAIPAQELNVVGAADREQRQGPGPAPGGELAQVQGARLAGLAAVPGQEPGEREPLGIGEHRLDRDENNGCGRGGH